MTDLPPNVYRVRQRDFDAIPGSPWVYWIPARSREIFDTYPKIGETHHTCRGIQTSDNIRFIRYWWEVGISVVCHYKINQIDLTKWMPYMKGGSYKKWFGNQEHVLNWQNCGQELYAFRPFSVIRNADLMLSEGMTFSTITAGSIGFRYMPSGFFWDQAGSALIPHNTNLIFVNLSFLNSKINAYLTKLVAPTINYTIGDIAAVPLYPARSSEKALLESLVVSCIRNAIYNEQKQEESMYFTAPFCYDTGLADLAAAEARLAALEAQIDDEVYRLYGISDADRAAIEAELAGKSLANDDEDMESALSNADEDATDTTPSMTPEELAVRWISYAIGIVLGRFTVGLVADPKIQNQKSTIGNAIYCREDFAVGSLPAPDEAEFDALVGPPERFAYVDEAGGRHVFPAEVEAALRALALPDGIAVLDAGHPRDLPALVEKALALMLDSSDMQYATCNGDNSIVHSAYQGTHTADVIRLGAGGDLRAFLSKDFFTQWHLKWYRKRPIYWPLQSAKRNYGFVLFHEKVEQYTLYILMRDYLDYKRNGVQLTLGDLAEQREAQSGAARRRTERRIAEVTALQEELAEFARTLDRLARAGYEPAPDWIDDGVLLRLAPLWEVIPLWKSEPRKAWEALEAGKYDWSHIAMRYWPERVKAACRENKSYAIAHNIFDF